MTSSDPQNVEFYVAFFVFQVILQSNEDIF